MTTYNNSGYLNPAYHDYETLEIDRREAPAWLGVRAPQSPTAQPGGDDASGGRWQEERQGTDESIPLGFISTQPQNPPWQHNLNHTTFQIDPDAHDRSAASQISSSMSANMTLRWRGVSARRLSLFPTGDPSHLFPEDVIRNELDNEEQDLVKELIGLSTVDRIQAVRALPMSVREKKHVRSQVLAFKSSKQSQQRGCCADCSESVSWTFRRFGSGLKAAGQALELWQGTMKEISGRFGTSVLTYFVFLKWLLMFNVLSFLINFGFITVPLLVYDPSPNIPPNVSFRGLEILTGVGYFNYTVMYYGGHSNETFAGQVTYNMQLAYFLTIAIYMVLCGLALIVSMAGSFRSNYVVADPSSDSAWQLLCSWDFNMTNERAVRQRKNNLRVQLKESLSENAQRKLLTLSEELSRLCVHLASWFLSTILALGCGASVYYLCLYEAQMLAADAASWSLLEEAKTLLVPFVVSLINLCVPLFYSLFNKFDHYSSHRRQIYALVVRNVFLKMFILGVLCYYWMDVVAQNVSCWESVVGQALYRLVIVDFLFLMLGSFFGEFLSNVIGTRMLPRIGVPEFDVARNVLELIYAQTLAWIGIYFAPLLPVLQIFKLFLLFYLKKISLTHNCQPPQRTGRAAQMQTIFTALLFFPFFVGALSIVAYTSWSLTPSENCGPFRGLNNSFGAVAVWIHTLEDISGSQWVIWIYQKIIKSPIFYFIVTLIILMFIYVFWQVTLGRKELIALLRKQIVKEGKDKMFLLEKLHSLQTSHPNATNKQANQQQRIGQFSDRRSPGSQSNSSALVQALLARQQFEGDLSGGVPVPADISTSSGLIQAMLAYQRAEDLNEDLYRMPDGRLSSFAPLPPPTRPRDEDRGTAGGPGDPVHAPGALEQAMQARQRAEGADDLSSSAVMMQVIQARQQEERLQWTPGPPHNPAPSGSSALIQAMLARQQAQNEFDDGY
ncbi:transmembrane channel-like protein 5 isoform X2 [Betta splendens]|uniref:Transmembrane channel-like protein n=1 Tax=Betta splendens TaxID=158456 RepID=A0A9W2XUZ4_BETSP|nr:transmembrane channel-like protein 5 isoform X2 [Betta splendens]